MQPKLAQKVYGLIAGLEQDKAPILLRDIAAIDCYNVYPDKIGNIRKAAGISKLYAQEMKASTAVNEFALLAYGEPITRELIGFAGDEISWYDSSVPGWTVLASGYSTAAGAVWRTVLYNEVLYMVNGVDEVQKGYYRRQFELDRFGADTTSALYLMQEAIGTSVADEGAVHTMTLSNAAMWDTTYYAFSPASIENDGGTSGYYGQVTHHADIGSDGAAKFTWKGWVYVRSDGESDVGKIIWKNGDYGIYVEQEAADKVKLSIIVVDAVGGRTRTTDSTEIDIDTWTYICVVYDGTEAAQADRIKIYVDGLLKASSGDDVNATLVGGSADLYILDNHSNDEAFDGYLDSLELMKGTALTATQILNDYEGGRWIKQAGVTVPTALTATKSATAGNPKGTYEYRCTFVRGNVEGSASPNSNVVTVNSKKIDLSNIPTGPGDVTARNIYRTSGYYDDFYFLATIDDNSTTTYQDDIADSVLILSKLLDKHGDAPPTGAHDICLHQSRVYYASGYRVYWSDVQNPESCYVYGYVISSGSGKGYEDVTALYAPFNDKVVVFTQDRVLYLTVAGDAITDATFEQTDAHLGCCAKRTIKNVIYRREASESDSYKERHHLVYLNKNKCLVAFDGNASIIISLEVKDLLDSIHDDHLDDCFAIHDVKNHQYILFYPSGDYSYCDKWVVWDYALHSFWAGGGMKLSCGKSIELSSEAEQLIVGQGDSTIGSYLYNFYDGNDHDGSAISSYFQTKFIDQRRHDIKKLYRYIDVMLDAIGNYDLTMQVFSDYNNTTTPNKSLTLNMLNAGYDYVNLTKFLTLKGNALSFKFTESSTNPAWVLQGFVLHFQSLVRRKGQ